MIKIFRSVLASCLSFCLQFVAYKQVKRYLKLHPSAYNHHSLPSLKKVPIVNTFVIPCFYKDSIVKAVSRNIAYSYIYKIRILNDALKKSS